MIQAPAKPAPAAGPVEKDTTAGNYFVSNYPPYSFWKPEHVAEVDAALERPPAAGTPLGIYLHIPFCRKRCHFCYFKVYTDKDSDGHQYVPGRRGAGDGVIRRQSFHQIDEAAVYLFRRRNAFVHLFGGNCAAGRVG